MTGFQSKRASALARLEALRESPSLSVGDEIEISRLEEAVDQLPDLVDLVMEQIRIDIENGDLTALEELLGHVPEDILKGFLSEDVEERVTEMGEEAYNE
jgi:hypothetical protein